MLANCRQLIALVYRGRSMRAAGWRIRMCPRLPLRVIASHEQGDPVTLCRNQNSKTTVSSEQLLFAHRLDPFFSSSNHITHTFLIL